MKDTKRILIVEDEPKVAFFLQESLEALNHGYQVKCAASGEDALDELSQAPADLVVSDLRMPGINGLELLQRVRDQNPTTQTILITAYGSDEVEAETRRLQTYRYFTKPFHIEDFTSAVTEALDDGVSTKLSGMLVMSGEQFDKITQRLSDLRYEVGAQCILLSDSSGQVLTEVGFTENLQSERIITLMDDGFANVAELAQHLREERSFNLHYHEGTRYDIYIANVGDQLFVTLIFDRRQGASRVGMVWLYTKRAVQDLLYLIASDDLLPPNGSAWPSDFGK
jgi:two-component system, response regulator, stage 0 sporulation protein F